MEQLIKIRRVFESQGIKWVEPYQTTEGDIVLKKGSRHRGLYYIYPQVNFYFGKAATNTVHARHKTHYLKLRVDLAGLYSTPVPKKEPKNKFPLGWKEAVCKYIIEVVDTIPDHYVKTNTGVIPGVLNFPVKHRVDVDRLTVLVWDLDHLTKEEISRLEDAIIPKLLPYANSESYQIRHGKVDN